MSIWLSPRVRWKVPLWASAGSPPPPSLYHRCPGPADPPPASPPSRRHRNRSTPERHRRNEKVRCNADKCLRLRNGERDMRLYFWQFMLVLQETSQCTKKKCIMHKQVMYVEIYLFHKRPHVEITFTSWYKLMYLKNCQQTKSEKTSRLKPSFLTFLQLKAKLKWNWMN